MSASTLPYGLKTPLTAKEYSELPEIIGYKDELIEGERVLTALPKLRHTLVIDNLASLLNRQFPNLRIAREAGWQFVGVSGLESVPGPDLMVVLPEDFREALRSAGYFRGRPEFVIEVISPSERRSRRLQKIGLYLEAGAGAVVEVDYTKRTVLVYRPDEDAPEACRGRIEWPFKADTDEIFAGL
jgi:Uma2 family endonuclease